MIKNNKNIFVVLLSIICLFAFSLFFTSVGVQTAKASSNVITLIEKAACRISQEEDGGIETSGLKFVATLDKQGFNNLYTTYDQVDAGIIIVPADFITAAGGHTFNALSAYSGLQGKTFYKITENFKENGSNYEFSNTIINIKPSNYNRDFSAVAFVKIVESDATLISTLTDYTYFDGAYYAYSNVHTACVYDIAYAAYNDRVTEETDGYFEIEEGLGVYGKLDGYQYDILKNYLDGVAVISTEDGINVANNSDWYTSPFGIAGGDGNYSVYNATSLTVDGNRCKTLAYSGDVNISVEQAQGATVDNNGVVTLAAADYTQWTKDPRSCYTKANNNYVSYEGNYGVGTYMQFVFTGNNMPSVMFFADDINGNFTYGGGESGLLVLNGFRFNNGGYTGKTFFYGPNRMNTPYDYIQTGVGEAQTTTLFAQNNVNATTEYRYVVGTKVGENNEIIVVGRIYDNSKFISVNMSDGLLQQYETTVKQTHDFSYVAEGEQYASTQKWNPARTLTKDMFSGTNIVVYGLTKADNSATVFKCFGPETGSLDINIQSSGMTKNADGSITLKAVSLPSSANSAASSLRAYNRSDNSFIGFQGNYGVGTYIDIIFKGNNMPNIMLLADNINGDMSWCGGDSGLFIATGYYFASNSVGLDTTRIYGPNRMNSMASHEDNNIGGSVIVTQQGLINAVANPETANREYKLTVGTKKGNQTANGYEVKLVMIMYDNNTQEELYKYEKTLTQKYDWSLGASQPCENQGRTLTTDLFSGTNIILYQAFKQDLTDTTFKYSMPYTINE